MRHLAVAVTAAMAVLLTGSGHLAAAPQQAAAPQTSGTAAAASNPPQRALLDKYCVTCHNQRLKTGGVMFDKMDLTQLSQHVEPADAVILEKAIEKLRGGMMPPLSARQPDRASVNSFVSWLETSLDRAEPPALNPGSVPLHRLNRTEYANAIRDILGLTIDPTALLPTDDVSDGFDNIANVLKVSPSFLDQYVTAARVVSMEAVGHAPPTGPVSAILNGTTGEDPYVAGGLPLGTEGGMLVRHLFPADGEYEFHIGAGRGIPPAAEAILTLDGAKIQPNTRVTVRAGMHKVGLTSEAHSFTESDSVLQSFYPGGPGGPGGFAAFAATLPGGAGRGRGGAGRGGAGRGGVAQGGRGGRGFGRPAAALTVTGPFNPTGGTVDTPSRQRIFVCKPGNASEELPCANRIFANIARQAFRRPVTDKDLDAPLAFFKQARATGDFDSGIQSGLMAILASPLFLYRAEPPPPNLKPGSIYHISDLELASRLSFFLWSSIPDNELLQLAEQRKLKDPAVLAHQVRRMLADPRSEALVSNFAFEWLKVRDMATFNPDPFIYPDYDASLKQAFRREMDLWIGSILREDRSVLDLLDGKTTFVNERLAAHYGIPNVRGTEFRRVTLADPNRWGVFGKGAVLMVTSYPNRTSVVLRGNFVLENITGTPPSAPPPNVPPFKENQEGQKAHTVREIMEQHRANPTCNACHGIIDPLGFALENFDSVGKWRNQDRFARTQIDASGRLVDGTPVNGPADLRNAMMKRSGQFVQTMTGKLLTYALGRNLEYYDMPTVRKIVRDSARDQYRFSSIVMDIVNSPAFQMRKIPVIQTSDGRTAALEASAGRR